MVAFGDLGAVMRKLVAIVILALLAPNAAGAAEWWYVTTDKDDQVMFVDRESVAPVSANGKRYLKAWKYGLYREATNGMLTDKVLYYVDCGAETLAMKSSVDYRPDGASFNSRLISDFQLSSAPVIPDSTGEALLRFACNAQKGAGDIIDFSVSGMYFFYAEKPVEAAEAVREEFARKPEPAPSSTSRPKGLAL